MSRKEFKDQHEIGAVLNIFPFMKEIVDEIKISRQRIHLIWIEPGEEVVKESTICAQGFNYTGWIYTIKDGKIYKKATWEEIRKQRKDLHLPDASDNNAQTLLDGSENACIFIHQHGEHDQGEGPTRFSITMFNCRGHSLFRDYDNVMIWLKEVKVYQELQKF
ncbi:MAG: hypothetical protein PHE59_02005 [Patescibacteria group bacterium]|nr:hypothetical protein [Patescibacteria group bacterium]MDD5164723.1 hypothetical protein [Patescibacteria group bacterium]MDD5534556.1 hypothetical protein [Patescibacteria group bacterium]